MNPSQRIPDGVETVTAEGADLARAVAEAASTIGIEAERVDFKLDLEHFRSELGTSVSRRTVKIIAWRSERPATEAPKKAKPKPKPAPREEEAVEAETSEEAPERKSRPKRTRSKSPSRKDDADGAPKQATAPVAAASDESLEDTDASTFAREWFVELMGFMDIEGEVKSAGNGERVQLWISADRAGRLIGKRGSTLGAIRHLLGLAVHKKFGELVIDVDVEDNRPRSEDGGERRERRDRGDRGDRKRRDRDDRGDRGDRGDRKRSSGGDRSRYPEAKLRALARRAAEKALDSGKTITINLELNSYDRRIVHMEVADVDGVNSRSEERDDGVKIIQVYPEGDDA